MKNKIQFKNDVPGYKYVLVNGVNVGGIKRVVSPSGMKFWMPNIYHPHLPDVSWMYSEWIEDLKDSIRKEFEGVKVEWIATNDDRLKNRQSEPDYKEGVE